MRLAWFVCLMTVTAAGCGGQAAGEKPEAAQQPVAPKAAAKNVIVESAATKTGASEAIPGPGGDEEIRTPATVAQAAKVLDLAAFPLLSGSKEPPIRMVASLGYQAAGDVKGAFEFQRSALAERGWKELSEAQIYDQSASGQFGKSGYHVSVSVSPAGETGRVAIRLQNHGNVNLSKLPVPPGTKFQYAFPGIASFETAAAVDETAAVVRKLLLDEGWQPYGTAGDSVHFRQNAVQLNARVLAPPAQPGKTVINYSTTLMSAELPAPPDGESVQYAESNKQLNLDEPGSPVDVANYYKSALAPAGWQPTTDNPVTDRYESFMIFRNPAKDMLTLNMRDLREEKKTRVSLKHQSAAEVEEIDRQVKLAVEERKRKEEEERNRPKPKASIALPEAARDVTAEKSQIEFHLASGKGKAAVDAIARQLADAGWKSEDLVGDAMAGELEFKKDGQRITILYADLGLIPAEITVSGSGVELERTTAK
jgi:hypothetical protein